nr:MAG TPA: hypothetical protein [Bacteriophage sp.]
MFNSSKVRYCPLYSYKSCIVIPKSFNLFKVRYCPSYSYKSLSNL